MHSYYFAKGDLKFYGMGHTFIGSLLEVFFELYKLKNMKRGTYFN